MNQPSAIPGDQAPVPQVVASYAAYLHARTHAAPETAVTGDHAQLTLSIGGKTLVLAFSYRSREWSLHGAELRFAGQIATFTSGQLADAVTALLLP